MKPYRLHYVSDIEGWAYWWVGLALQKYAPPHVIVTLGCNDRGADRAAADAAGADVVLNMTYQDNLAFSSCLQRRSPHSILVGTFNVAFEMGGQKYLPMLAETSTHVVCNNRETWIESVRRGIMLPERSSFISIGVDGNLFVKKTPLATRKPKLLLNCSVGHAQWKGAYLLREMSPMLSDAGFETDVLIVDSHGADRLNQPQLVDWYNDGLCYVCMSEHDGTPMTVLEAACCGCVIVTTNVGNMPELIIDRWNGVILKDREPATIMEAVNYAAEHRDRLTTNMAESIKPWCWDQRAACYFRLFDRLIRRKDLV